jgi:hypothetical protein
LSFQLVSDQEEAGAVERVALFKPLDRLDDTTFPECKM